MKKTRLWRLILFLVALGRIIGPFFVFLTPVLVAIVLYFLDSVDGYLAFRSKLTWKQYHLYDKVLDYWWYIFILLFSFDKPIFPIILILFIYRSIGQVLTVLTLNETLLIFFPNILEHYFWFYLASFLVGGISFLFQWPFQILPLLASFVVAVVIEYMIHYKKQYMANYLFHLNINWKKNK